MFSRPVLSGSIPGFPPRRAATRPLHRDAPSGWLVDPRHDAEQRAFAGAIPAQQREPIATLERQVHRIQCLHHNVVCRIATNATARAECNDLFFQGSRAGVEDRKKD